MNEPACRLGGAYSIAAAQPQREQCGNRWVVRRCLKGEARAALSYANVKIAHRDQRILCLSTRLEQRELNIPDRSRTCNLRLRSLIDFLTKSFLNPLPNINLQQNIVDAEAKSCPNLAQTLCVLIKSWQHLPANNKAAIMALLSIDK